MSLASEPFSTSTIPSSEASPAPRTEWPVLVLRDSYRREWPRRDADPETLHGLFGADRPADGFLDHLRALGFGRGDVGVVNTHQGQDEFGRDYDWSSLPLVEDPALRHPGSLAASSLDEDARAAERGMRRDAPRTGSAENVFTLPCLEKARLVVVQSTFGDETAWHLVVPFLRRMAEAGIPLVLTDGVRIETVEPDRLAERFASVAASARFVHSHAVNFGVMAGRIVNAIARDEDWTLSDLRRRSPDLHWLSWQSLSPFALQLLYAIRRLGLVVDPAEAVEMRAYDERAVLAIVRSLPFFERTGDLERWDLVWKGTGRHPAWRAGFGELHPSGRLSAVDHDKEGSDAKYAVSRLVGSGWISWTRDGRIGLSSFCLRILDMLGEEFEDADCLLRWRGGKFDVPAMDRWINSKFRRLKRKVAGLPATLARPGGIPEDRHRNVPDGREAIAYGEVVDLSDDDLRDPEVIAALDRLDPATIDFEIATSGLLFREQRVRPDPRPRAFWIGVPLATCLGGFWIHRRILKFADVGLLRDEVLALRDKLPPALSRLCVGRLGLLSAGRVADEPKTFVGLPCVLPGTKLDDLTWIVTGRCLFDDGTGKEMPWGMRIDFGFHGHVGDFGLSPGIEKRGPRGGPTTMWFGYRFGVLDRATGRLWAQDLSDPEVAVACRRERDGADHLGSLLMLHPDVTEDGIWAVHPDGTFEPFDPASWRRLQETRR